MKFPYSMLLDYVETNLDADSVGGLLTMAGFELEAIENVEGEPVLDIKVVSNRGDGLSVFGLAREILAKQPEARPTALYLRALRRFDAAHVGKIEDDKGVRVTIETEACSRYACLIFDGVFNGASPEWVQKPLRLSGQRPISLLVDLTNYVMLEVGQPLHAFDLDRIEGPSIVVRQARIGEKLTTLDGQEHELNPGQMVICDASKPVAAAGIMGGETTEVSASTTRMLLESAHFESMSVRRTRKQLGLSTEASYRFERSVDPEGVVAALERFAELLAQSDPKSRIPGVIDIYPRPCKREAIPVDLARSDTLLGMHVSEAQAIGYLERLGFGVELGTPLRVTPPTWRPDVVRQEDVVEELGRVHGYEQIPELLPVGTTVMGGVRGFEAWCEKVKRACVRSGFTQTISHSLKDVHPLDDPTLESIGPRNPVSEMAWLRNSLLPSLAENAARNGGKDIHIFEMGRVFGRTSGRLGEHYRLGLLSQGLVHGADWLEKQPATAGFFSMKGSLQNVFADAGIDVRFEPSSVDARLHPTKQASLVCREKTIGIVGQLHPDVADEAGLPADTLVAELHLLPAYQEHHAGPRLKPISRNPAVRRDIALLIDKSVPYAAIEQALEDSIGSVLEKRWLFDVYEGKGIPEGKHSLAIALQLRKSGENFTDEEANRVREKAVQALASLGGIPR